MKSKFLLLLLIVFSAPGTLLAGEGNDSTAKKEKDPYFRYYTANAFETAMFSTATIKKESGGIEKNTTGTLRFNMFTNIGFTFNFNTSRHFGIYTGVDLKNIGFIEKTDSFTIKRRVYSLGVPLAIRIGKMTYPEWHILIGGGIDIPFNYREKEYKERPHKTTFSEWFSERTPQVLPYVFIGTKLTSGISLKAQYYPGNFLDPGYTKDNVKPYAGYNVHLILLTIGFHLNFTDMKDFTLS